MDAIGLEIIRAIAEGSQETTDIAAIRRAFKEIEDRANASLKAAAEQEPFGWIQVIDGEATQNFARDGRELELFKSIAILLGREKGVEYMPLYTHPIASEDSERLAFVMEHGLPRKIEQADGSYRYLLRILPFDSCPTSATPIEAIDAARREGK